MASMARPRTGASKHQPVNRTNQLGTVVETARGISIDAIHLRQSVSKLLETLERREASQMEGVRWIDGLWLEIYQPIWESVVVVMSSGYPSLAVPFVGGFVEPFAFGNTGFTDVIHEKPKLVLIRLGCLMGLVPEELSELRFVASR